VTCPDHCNDGWQYHQALHKPQGVIGHVCPCPVCNPDGERPDPWPKPTFTIGDSESVDGLLGYFVTPEGIAVTITAT
jgi:hypothetical protein